MKLSNDTILITGGTSGIGFELAKQLTARGNKVIVTGRDRLKLEKAKKLIPELEVIQSDVTDVKDIESLVSRIEREFPQMNILVNNAGTMRKIDLHRGQDSLNEVTCEIETNLNGPIRMAKAFLPHLKSKSFAAIVNVSSGLAFVPLPTSPVYCATKAGLHSFTLSLRQQLKLTRIAVFELAPPATQTELLAQFESEDLKGIGIMSVEDMVAAAIKGIERDHFEICPGQSGQLKLMNRLAPQFILKQMSKSVDRMLLDERE
jgi:uncharacterized oxidoreductase